MSVDLQPRGYGDVHCAAGIGEFGHHMVLFREQRGTHFCT